MKLSTKKRQGGEYDVFIGAVKVAEIHFINSSPNWTVELHHYGAEPRVYETMIKAIQELVVQLDAKPPEDSQLVK